MIVGGRSNSNGITLSQTISLTLPSADVQCWSLDEFQTPVSEHHVLPDGKVLATGGQQCDGGRPSFNCPAGAANFPEIWNPVTKTWTTLAENPTHITAPLSLDCACCCPMGACSSAVAACLLQTATGWSTQPQHRSHVFRKSTRRSGALQALWSQGRGDLFAALLVCTRTNSLAPRPAITQRRPRSTLGETFNVSISSGLQVNSAALMRLPTVTHGLNFDQRRVVLTLQVPSTTNLTLTIPSRGTICPPGYYMLFVMNSSGVPSVSKMIKVISPADRRRSRPLMSVLE